MPREKKQKIIRNLKQEVQRLREFVAEVHELSAELVDGEGAEQGELMERLRREMHRLREMVFTDELTQIWNRRGFYETFTRLFREALSRKNDQMARKHFIVDDFSVVFIDLDNFKTINDTYGHNIGDEVLKDVAQALQESIRDIDGVARFGGEEFVIALVGAREARAYEIGEKLREKLSRDVVIERSGGKTVTASIGVASLSSSDADDLDELVGYADKAMYEAKTNRGKNNVVKYSELSL